MKKVLIISYHFPPVNTIGARRFGEMAPYLEKFGWQPFILTTNSKGDLPVLISEENIIRIGENCFNDKTLISEEGYRGIPWFLKPIYFFYKKFKMEIWSIDRFLFSWGREVLKNMERVKKINPDVILATFDPAVDLWLGYLISKKLRKPWLADFRDPCSLSNYSNFPLIKWLDKKIDKFLTKRASLITAISTTMARDLENFYKKPVAVIYNGFNKKNEAKAETKFIAKNGRKIIYYAGCFHANRIKAIKLLIDWLARNKENNFHFLARSLGPKEANQEILNYAKEKDILSKVEIKEPVLPEVVFQEESKADILVLFEDLRESHSSLQAKSALPVKLFEYLVFSSPILAIAFSKSEIGFVLNETKRGYLVSNLQELDDALKNKIPAGNFNLEPDKIKEYSRESQSENLCRLFNQLLKC